MACAEAAMQFGYGEGGMMGEERVKVWDIGVRLFHWTLLALFTLAYLSGDDDGTLHAYAGYAVIALLVFRTVWGFVGTRHARFADFVRGRAATMAYARSMLSGRPTHYLGHNPLGGWMVIALLLALAATSWSGLEAYAAEGHGPLAVLTDGIVPAALANDDEDERERDKEHGGDEFWEEVHELLADLTLALVFAHIAGVAVGSLLHRENLVKAMITGYKVRRKP